MKCQTVPLEEQVCVVYNHWKIQLSQAVKSYTIKYTFSTPKVKFSKKGVAWPDDNMCSVPALDSPAWAIQRCASILY